MSSQSPTLVSARKISLPLGWLHQLPRIGPAIASARLGTGPPADASTTPCRFTNEIGFRLLGGGGDCAHARRRRNRHQLVVAVALDVLDADADAAIRARIDDAARD